MNIYIEELLKDAIEKTIEDVTSNEMIRQCKLAWHRGFQFGLLLGSLFGIVITLIIMLV